ncbi:putative TMEM14 family protein [Medicago truncatula]|uniref:Putative TMEM14 family protein n=1 Tax=Medicago truncatula TaxID=3880 RepID=B7FFA9_MEDTR|nr:protein FATTY ACID EXPORT 2, chloroplastic [Medicago truncatula]ACJ83299.1 unknown [Medicago truncatula]AFK35773.1 unknown [Medicago truncatula]KEH32405.1 transmembrane protein 14C [Medicago truncatula]RHN64494.1 putative TMEM14 family protein [Medicago truncatula]
MAETAAVFGVSNSTIPSLSLRPTTGSHTPTTFTRSFLASPPSFPYLSLSNSHSQLAVVSSDSKTTQFDLSAPDLDNTGGGGDIKGNGDDFSGGGGGGEGGGGGDDSGKGEEGSDGDKRNMALSMSQKLTLGYAILVGAGGVMGFLKSGSQKSLLAGGLSSALLFYVFTELPGRPVLASSVGLGISAALLVVMGSRFKKSGKVFPAGVVSLVSFIMTGGYLHGIMRSSH